MPFNLPCFINYQGYSHEIVQNRNTISDMKLLDCDTLINVEGKVYKLSEKQYNSFIIRQNLAMQHQRTLNYTGESWSDLLHWVEDSGKLICFVNSFNY